LATQKIADMTFTAFCIVHTAAILLAYMILDLANLPHRTMAVLAAFHRHTFADFQVAALSLFTFNIFLTARLAGPILAKESGWALSAALTFSTHAKIVLTFLFWAAMAVLQTGHLFTLVFLADKTPLPQAVGIESTAYAA